MELVVATPCHTIDADGGSGNDRVIGANSAKLLGGSGSDEVINDEGNPSINCGSGSDSVDRNGATDVKSCESDLILS